MDIDFKQWQYFQSLEDDFIRTLRFVELDSSNLETHSIEFSKLLLLIGAEFESVSKELIKTVDPEMKVGDIAEIKGGILTNFKKICKNEVRISNYKMTIFPFENWDNGGQLDWWNSYNNLKHNRLKNFENANLGMTLNAIGGLLIVLVYLYRYRNEFKHLMTNNDFMATDGMGQNYVVLSNKDIADKIDNN
ncbi:hypothetical protein L3049_20980 [Labilibaculum sp. DW002]|uniref:Uncharacterized protein n=1 Tax=Paralabilibaculum antarcticum TaxID=2912572 RepID=A0ABT5VYI8_9BACT|nr:hypothetical protein [Labilibaculum sp. DW002]MDE5420473.1 hypothetical protein [Labilibaculum sp. DW002]